MKALISIFSIMLITATTKAQISGDTIPCYGTQQVYSLSGGSGFLFWSATGSNLTQNLTGGQFLVQWTNVGTYTITCIYTDNVNPSKIDTAKKTIIVQPMPNPLISVLNSQSACQYTQPGKLLIVSDQLAASSSSMAATITCYSVCDSGLYTYTASGLPGSTFTWFTPGNNSITPDSRGDTVHVNWSAPLPQQYTDLEPTQLTVVETSSFGCKDSNSICISVNGKPHACFMTTPQDSSGIIRVCEGSTVAFNDSCTWIPQWIAHPSTIIDRTWIFGDGSVAINQSVVTHQYNTPGTYKVLYIAQSNCYCADTFSKTVHVDSSIGPDIQCISTVCHNTWATYYVKDTCSHTFNWTVTGADSIRASNDSLFVLWGSCNGGYGTISVTTDCPSYCPYQSVVRVPVIPADATIVGPGIVCQGDNAIFSAPFVQGTAYEWFGPDTILGHYTAILHSDSDTHLFSNYGNNISDLPKTSYVSVAYTNQFLGCNGFSTAPVTVAAGLRIKYVVGDSIICYHDSLKLESLNDISSHHVRSNWSVYSLSSSTRVDTVTNNAYYFSNTLPSGSYIIYAYPHTGVYCNIPVSVVVTIASPPPPLAAPVIGSDTVCPNILFTYYSVPTNASQYYLQWNTIRGIPTNGSGDQFSVAWSAPLPDTLFVSQRMLKEPGCLSSPEYVAIYPNARYNPIINGDTTVCTDGIESYKTAFSADEYTWSILPGTSGSVRTGAGGDSISVQWNHFSADTIAYLMLIATKCGYLDSSTIAIHIVVPPVPTIAVSPSPPYCTNKNITFTSSVTSSNYAWDFGDGTTVNSSTNGVIHQFTNDSAYTVRLVISNSSQCLYNGVAVTTVNIFPSPVAFLSTPENIHHCGDPAGWQNNLYVTLQNMSNVGFTYQFFYNGSSVSGSGSVYDATKTGTYYAIVTNSTGCSGTTNTITIDSICSGGGDTGGCSTPYSISFNDNVYCDSVVFTAGTNANVTFSSWDFDEPSSPNNYSSINPAYHLYAQAGYYHPIVYGSATSVPGPGTCSVSYQLTDTVPLVANFLDQFHCEGGVMHLQLIDISTYLSTITSWQWYVNGTLISNNQNVDTPMSAGAKTITLIVSDGLHSCTASRIIVVPSPPNANFTYTDSQCITAPINLFPIDTTNIISYLWNFGDDSYSALQNTSKVYNTCFNHFGIGDNCNIQIALIEMDKYGCKDSASAIVYYFSDPFTGKTLQFASSLIEACANNSQVIEVQTKPTTTSFSDDNFSWNNGYSGTSNTLTVSQSGSYTVTVTNEWGCSLPSNGASSVIFNTVQGIISGDTIYCYNDYTDLNIFEGFQYEYYWLYQEAGNTSTTYATPPSSHGYEFSKLVSTASPGYTTYKVWGVIRDTFSTGTYCDDTIGPLNISMYPVIPNITGGASNCASQQPAVFIATQYPGWTVLWNTGLLSDTLITTIPGTYYAEYIDTNGCIDPVQVAYSAIGAPDLSQLITGCYTFCLGDTPKLYVPTNITRNTTIQWLFNGSPLANSYTYDHAGDIYALQAGSYQLALTNRLYGCSDTSQPIYISFTNCSDSCFKHASIFCSNCYYDTITGKRYINLLISINDTILTASSVTVLSQNLNNLNFWPTWLPVNHGGTDYLNIQGVADSASNGQYCVEVTINGCHQLFCINASSMSCTGAVAERSGAMIRKKTRDRNAIKRQKPLRYD